MTAGFSPEQFYRSPNVLADGYQAFRVRERILLTGHSHQAWPDCARAAQLEAWDDAARWVDEKWSRAREKAEAVRAGFARLLDDEEGDIALGGSTHELVIRFLSALPWGTRRKLVTTDGEFYSLDHQLRRLEETGRVAVCRVAVEPVGTLTERLGAAIDDRTAAVLVSSVFYESALVLPELTGIAEACERVGAELLLDVYHHLNVLPFSVRSLGLQRAFIVGGGYKYCQLGEGNCFLRFPRSCRLQPVISGWFARLGHWERESAGGSCGGPARFEGATYDPTSHYRAAAVFARFSEWGLTPSLLHEVNRHQVKRLVDAFAALDLNPEVVALRDEIPLAWRGGFLSLRSSCATALQRELARRDVHVDARGDCLRLGPAPYCCDQQLDDAMTALKESVQAITGS